MTGEEKKVLLILHGCPAENIRVLSPQEFDTLRERAWVLPQYLCNIHALVLGVTINVTGDK